MNLLNKIAFVCYSLVIVLALVFACIYLFRPEFMPYHAKAVGKSWDELERGMQVLILALMRVSGGGWLATTAGMAWVLIVPFRNGIRWSKFALPIIGFCCMVPTLYATLFVKLNSPANPPWYAATFGGLLILLGFILSMIKKNN